MTNRGRTLHTHLGMWRADIWKDVWVALTAKSGGPIATKDLARDLGMEPRALAMLVKSRPDLFLVEYRNDTGRGRASELYARINPDRIEPAPAPRHAQIVQTTTAGTTAAPRLTQTPPVRKIIK